MRQYRWSVIDDEGWRLRLRLLAGALRTQLTRDRRPVIVYMDRRGEIHTTVRDEPVSATVIGAYTEVPEPEHLWDDVRAALGSAR